MNTAKLPHKVHPIFGGSLASSRIIEDISETIVLDYINFMMSTVSMGRISHPYKQTDVADDKSLLADVISSC